MDGNRKWRNDSKFEQVHRSNHTCRRNEMADEIIDVYDDMMNRIGTMTKKGAHLTGTWHKAFHCWIVYKSADGEPHMVVQRRGPDKLQFPNALDITAAGHYLAGETVADGLRELQEDSVYQYHSITGAFGNKARCNAKPGHDQPRV